MATISQFTYKTLTPLPKDILSNENPINGFKTYASWVLTKSKEWGVEKFTDKVFQQHETEFGEFLESINVSAPESESLANHFKNIHNAALKIYKVLTKSQKGYKQTFTNQTVRTDIITAISENISSAVKEEISEVYKNWEDEKFLLDSDKTWLLNNYLNNAEETQFSKALSTMLEFMAQNPTKNDARKLFAAFKLLRVGKYEQDLKINDFNELYSKAINYIDDSLDNDFERFITILDSFGLIEKTSPTIIKTKNNLIKTYKVKQKRTASKSFQKIVVLGMDKPPKDYPVSENNLSGALMDFHKKADWKQKKQYNHLGPNKNNIRFRALETATYAESLPCYYFLNLFKITPQTFYEKNIKFAPKTIEEVQAHPEKLALTWTTSEADPDIKLKSYTIFDNEIMPLVHAGGGVPDLEMLIKDSNGNEISTVVETTCYDTGRESQQNEESALGHSLIQMLKSCKSKQDLHKPALFLITLFDKTDKEEYPDVNNRMTDFVQLQYSKKSIEQTYFKKSIKEELNAQLSRLDISWEDLKPFFPAVNVIGFRDLCTYGEEYIQEIKNGSFFKKYDVLHSTKCK